MSTQHFLEVDVKFPVIHPPAGASVKIGFPETEQAKWYHDRITQTRLHRDLGLECSRRDRHVSVRLPSRFTNIRASSKCDGFYFTVIDKALARQWVESMIIWKTLRHCETHLYVVRNWAEDPVLGRLLLDLPSSPANPTSDSGPGVTHGSRVDPPARSAEVIMENGFMY